jgi:hypothetical protein
MWLRNYLEVNRGTLLRHIEDFGLDLWISHKSNHWPLLTPSFPAGTAVDGSRQIMVAF